MLLFLFIFLTSQRFIKWATPHPDELRRTPMGCAAHYWTTPHPETFFECRSRFLSGYDSFHWVKHDFFVTLGQERFRTMTPAYYRGTHGVIVVYDVTSAQSFASLKRWFQEIGKLAGPAHLFSPYKKKNKDEY
jgi:hypothetical protein